MLAVPAITVRSLSKKFRLFASPKKRLIEALHPFRKQFHREFWAVRDVSFEVGRGEIVGILGKNGSGKSTLLQIICSVMQATSGEVHVNGRISALLELGAGFNPEFTGRENVVLNGAIMGLSRRDMAGRLPQIEAFADIGEFFDQPVKTYSSGMFVRVAFAAAIHVDPDILVVDEALSVGDSKFQHRCFQRIREFMERGKTILVVSHSTDTLLRICHRGVVMDKGRLLYIGPISDAVNCYQSLLFGTESSLSEDRNARDVSRDAHKEQACNGTDVLRSISVETADVVGKKPCYNRYETRLGSGVAKIIDFDLVAGGRAEPEEIPRHADIDLIIKVRFDQPLSNVSVGFALVSIDGTYVFGTNLAMMGAPLLSADAGAMLGVRFRWASSVAGGDYFLNVGCNHIVNGEDQYIDVRRSVARLKFADTPASVGFVDLSVSHDVIEIASHTQGRSQ